MKDLLDNWLVEILSEGRQPDDSIKAFNFGLLRSDNGYKMYLTGSKAYDKDNDDWACEEDYAPEKRYLSLPEDLGDNSWSEILEFAVAQLKTWRHSDKFRQSFLQNAEYITTGFDDGDLMEIK